MSDTSCTATILGPSPFQPAPGGLEAVLAGCSCSKIDNFFGCGFRLTATSELIFAKDPGCPLHGAGVPQ